MLTTIVFFLALLLSIIVIARIFNDLVDGVNNKDFYITPLFIVITCIIWSWLFWLLH